MATTLRRFKTVGLDSNIFSYQFHQDPTYGPITKQIFDLLSFNKLHAATSFITLAELLSIKAPLPKIKQLESLFLRTPNLEVFEVNHDVAAGAAKIRREYGLRLPDAIQLATAIVSRQQAFISNDSRLKRVKEIKIIILDDFKGVKL